MLTESGIANGRRACVNLLTLMKRVGSSELGAT